MRIHHLRRQRLHSNVVKRWRRCCRSAIRSLMLIINRLRIGLIYGRTFGFARELSAIFEKPLRLNPLNFRPSVIDKRLPTKKIHIQDGAALAYYGLSLSGIEVKAAPLWMQARLFNIGQRPINNVVDTSNYVMFDIGQPNHAFDAHNLRHPTISIALSQDIKTKTPKKFTALDGVDYPIASQTILIYDGTPNVSADDGVNPTAAPQAKGQVVALGGIIGGSAASVQPDTRELFVESATFPRALIRRSIAALGLRTDAAQRFEKGQDPAQAEPALYRFAQLLKQNCPQLRVGQMCGAMPQPPRRSKIKYKSIFYTKTFGLCDERQTSTRNTDAPQLYCAIWSNR